MMIIVKVNLCYLITNKLIVIDSDEEDDYYNTNLSSNELIVIDSDDKNVHKRKKGNSVSNNPITIYSNDKDVRKKENQFFRSVV